MRRRDGVVFIFFKIGGPDRLQELRRVLSNKERSHMKIIGNRQDLFLALSPISSIFG